MNTIDSFIKNSSGLADEDFDIVACIAPEGDFKRVRGIEAILSSWDVILRTPQGSYDNDPSFGSNLINLLFEPADSETIEKIKNEIVNKLRIFDPRATIKNISVSFLSDRRGFNVDMLIEYKGLQKNLSLNVDEKSYFQFMNQ